MNKDIVCGNKDCKYNEFNHCFFYNSYIMINDEGFCENFEAKEHWQEGIQETVSKEAYTKSDLKDIEKNKAKYGTKNER